MATPTESNRPRSPLHRASSSASLATFAIISSGSRASSTSSERLVYWAAPTMMGSWRSFIGVSQGFPAARYRLKVARRHQGDASPCATYSTGSRGNRLEVLDVQNRALALWSRSKDRHYRQADVHVLGPDPVQPVHEEAVGPASSLAGPGKRARHSVQLEDGDKLLVLANPQLFHDHGVGDGAPIR